MASKNNCTFEGIPKWFTLKMSTCRKCKLCETRRQVVIGRGPSPATILFMGEAPGKTEDLLGQAFIGPSGKLLDRILLDAQALTEREQDKKIMMPNYFICNTVLCRPTDCDMGENREPSNKEVIACMPNISQIVSFVNPKVVVFIGKVAEKYYGKEFKNFSTSIMHPSFLLRNGGPRSPYYLQTVRTLSATIKEILFSNFTKE